MTGSKLTFRAFAEISGILIGAVSIIYVSRVVGPEYLGFSATTSAIMLLVSRLADGGLTSLATQRLARDDEKASTLLALTIPAKIISSAILIVCTLITSRLVPIDNRLFYFISITVFMVFFDVCAPSWIFVALGKINVVSAMRIASSILYGVSIFALIRKPDDWIFLPYITLFNSFSSFAVVLYCLYRYRLYSIDTFSIDRHYFFRVRGIYQESYHFLKADISAYVYSTSDRLILYFFTGSYVVGLYEAAYKIINPFYSISTIITPTVFRELAQSFKQGNIERVMAKFVFSMSLCTIPLGFFLLLFSNTVIDALYKSRFTESSVALNILGFVITLGFVSGIIVLPFSAWNMSKEYGNSLFWGNILNTILNLALIPFFGAVGAALATLGAKIIVGIVAYRYFIKATTYPILKELSIFVFLSIIALLVVVVLRKYYINDYIGAALFISVYGLGCLVVYFKYFKLRMGLGVTCQ